MLLWGRACVVCISPQLVSSASRPFSLLRKPQQPRLGLDEQRYLSRRGRMDGPWPASCCAPWPVSLDEAHRGPWELWPSSCLYISGRGPSMLGARLFPFPSQAWRLGSKKRRRDPAAPWEDEVSRSKSQLLPNKGRESWRAKPGLLQMPACIII